MSSASKALDLLSLFAASRPEIGLSQMCRLAKRDKATTYRHLSVLEAAGLVEKNPVTRHYRLGPALLQLGRLREMTVPREAGAEAALTALAEATGETAHVSVLSGDGMYALMSYESPRHSTRAVIDVTTFPLHATASGLAALAFGPEDLFGKACETLAPYTRSTPTTPEALRPLVDDARTSGFARSDGRYEDEIHSLSVPIFDQTGQFAGAASVASVAARFTPAQEQIVKAELVQASRAITRNWGGTIPPEIETAWSRTMAAHQELETAS